ncbi:hypothetical protein Hamer_G014144 [Homarus americanus]|uniref:Uncharacterized protein n=1 Tax=Homarus americanus TaxID=6706 RepID=A0A8J5JT41_HOMAM|nr:hypothetical protein Hamer_G014144 [Homarus americanus]
MKSLPRSIKDQFLTMSHWVIPKTMNKLTVITLDQAHEQKNKFVKSSGGYNGLMDNLYSFKRWVVSGPEPSRLIKQFEGDYLPDDDPGSPQNFKHHVQGLSSQMTFKMKVNSLSNTMRKMGNPFLTAF